jgi:hypothetical protein
VGRVVGALIERLLDAAASPGLRLSREAIVTAIDAAVAQQRAMAVGYWITWSARSTIVCGTAIPSAFAVFMLTTSSNDVGCSTGSSAGTAPRARRPM